MLPFCDTEVFTSARKDRIRANVILPLCHIIGSHPEFRLLLAQRGAQ